MLRARFAVFALVLAAACAPFARSPGKPLIAPDSLIAAKREMAVAAFGRLQRALDAKDTMAVAMLLHPEVDLVTPTNDTLYGATAWQYLTLLVADSSRYVRLGAGKFEPCLDGDVYQFNGDYRPRGSGVQTTGRFGIRWATDERSVVARRILLSSTRSSLRRKVGCDFEYKVASANHKVTFALAPSLNPIAAMSPGRDVEQTLRARGFAYTPPPFNGGVFGPGASPFPFKSPGYVALVASLRHRNERTFSRELQAEIAYPSRTAGFRSSDSTWIDAKGMPLGASLLLQYQRRPFRFGIGPSLRATRWSVHEDRRSLEAQIHLLGNPIQPMAQLHTSWKPVPGEPATNSVKWSLSPGAVVEIARLMPMTRRYGAELQLRGAVYGKSTLPATPRFSPSTSSNYSLGLGLSFSKGWR